MTSPTLNDAALAELGIRFRHARRSALRAVLTETSADETEVDLLFRAWREDPGAVQRGVFCNSRALGQSFARFHRVRIGLWDLPRVLPLLDSACADGVFTLTDDGRALLLLREGCRDCSDAICAYWREALGGLVLGASGEVLHSRWLSRGSGAERCEDAFYVDRDSPYSFAAIPPALAPVLAQVARLAKAFDSNAELSFLGLNEDTLSYRLTRAEQSSVSLTGLIERAVLRQFPNLRLREVSSRAVSD
ncbi:MAG: hypothetical protein ACOY0T_00190 [Myxococcota bacterium]